MYWESALSLCVEVSIGIAGFSGVIAVLKSGQSKLSEQDRVALEVLLGASGWTMLFGVLPFALADSLAPELLWHVCSGLYAISWLFIGVSRYLELSAGRISKPVAVRIMVSVAIFSAVQLANTFWLGVYWPYMLILMLQLGNAFVMFVRLLKSMWSDV